MTIPNLIENFQKKITVNQLIKKMYSITKQAVMLSKVDNDEVEGWDWELAEKDIYQFSQKYFAPYFKGSQLYKGNEFAKVVNNKYEIKNLANKTIVTPFGSQYVIIILLDGSYFITKEKHGGYI